MRLRISPEVGPNLQHRYLFLASTLRAGIMALSMSTLLAPNPRAEYQRRLELRRRAAEQKDRVELRIATARFALFVAAAVMAWLSFRDEVFPAWWLLLPFIAFVVLVVLHERVRREHRRFDRAAAFYERGIARIDNHWAGAGESGSRFLDKSHPYAEDLDLFGAGSLFELICSARTRAGEETLASWLTSPAAPDTVRARQAAVGELRSLLDLREDLAVLGADIGMGVNPKALAAWGAAPHMLDSRWVPAAAGILASATSVALLLWIFLERGRDLFLLLGLAEGVVILLSRACVRRVIDEARRPCQDLELLSLVLRRLESGHFESARLAELRRELDSEGHAPSVQIARLNRFVVMQQQLFTPLAILLLWDIQMAYAIEAWRRNSGPAVARWLSVVGEMEALCSMAGHSFEHPSDPFPEISAEGQYFEAEGIGHPLIPDGQCVRNDVRLGADLRVLVVSGSNMSGKSTLLRAIGTNAVLALAGAPVRARRLRLSPLTVGASIQKRDSLQEGTSRFYAEITRLRQLVDITDRPLPLLFLLDELLHGTNSHDRSIGAEALVADLVKRGAIGLLTTHDLALAHIAEALAPRADNVHFEDFVKDGKLVFDYRLRPGVVRKSNALELMRSIGLRV